MCYSEGILRRRETTNGFILSGIPAGVDPGYIRQLLIAERIKGAKPGGRDWLIAKEEGDR